MVSFPSFKNDAIQNLCSMCFTIMETRDRLQPSSCTAVFYCRIWLVHHDLPSCFMAFYSCYFFFMPFFFLKTKKNCNAMNMPFLTLMYYRVLSSCCLLFMMFHALVHVSLPPVAQCDVLAGVLCMLCMLYTVCSTYLSCLFVQWAANIPAL